MQILQSESFTRLYFTKFGVYNILEWSVISFKVSWSVYFYSFSRGKFEHKTTFVWIYGIGTSTNSELLFYTELYYVILHYSI